MAASMAVPIAIRPLVPSATSDRPGYCRVQPHAVCGYRGGLAAFTCWHLDGLDIVDVLALRAFFATLTELARRRGTRRVLFLVVRHDLLAMRLMRRHPVGRWMSRAQIRGPGRGTPSCGVPTLRW